MTATAMTSAAIRAELSQITLALNEARKDAALFEKLQNAASLADNLSKQCTTLTAQLADAQAKEAKEAKAAFFARFDGIRIDVGGHDPDHVLRALYTIHYRQKAYDSGVRANVWTDHSVQGFAALPADARQYLIEAKPEAIPPAIMALAPGDAPLAMARYAQAAHRGCVRR